MIRIFRKICYGEASRLDEEGRTRRRDTLSCGERWTRRRRRARKSQGGLDPWAKIARAGRTALEGSFRRHSATRVHAGPDPVAKTNAAYGKTVWSWLPLLQSSQRRRRRPTGPAARRQFADDGGKNEFVSGESAA